MNKLLVILCFSSVYFISCLSRCKIVVNEDNSDLAAHCINQVLKNVYNPKDLVLVSSNIVGLSYPAIHYNWRRSLKMFSYLKIDIAVICLDENEDYSRIVHKMSKEPFFNPKAKYVVISKHLSSELLEVSSKYYLTDIIFIETVDKSFHSIYTYEPYQNQNISFKPETFKYLTQCKSGIPDTFELFGRYKVPKAWKNSTLNIIYNVIPPYFQCPSCEDGIEAQLLEIVSRKLGFDVNYVEHADFMYWGSKMNGTYTYILQKLFERKCDMVIGAFHNKFEEHLDFDATFTFMIDGLFWLVPKAEILSGYKKLALVLNFEIFLLLLVTMIVTPIVCRLLYKKDVLDYFFVLYRTLLEAALPRFPRHKIVYFHIVIPFLIVSTGFKGSLIHVLSVDHYEYQISTFEDILASNLTIKLDYDIAQYFRHDREVYKRYEYCAIPRECINRTAFERDVVTVDFQRTYEYQLPIFYVDSEGKPLLYLFREPIFPLYIHWYFVKGFPIFHQIDNVLLRLKSSGIIHHLCDKSSFKAKVDLSRKVGIASNILGMKEMGPLLILISFGHFLGLVVFLLELCTALKRKKREA